MNGREYLTLESARLIAPQYKKGTLCPVHVVCSSCQWLPWSGLVHQALRATTSHQGCRKLYQKTKNHITTLQTDHRCVLNSCRYLQNKSLKIAYLPVKWDGLGDLELVVKAITPETLLVSDSVMMVNNEIDMYCYITSALLYWQYVDCCSTFWLC